MKRNPRQFSEGSNIVGTQWDGPLPEPASLMGTPMQETALADAWDQGWEAGFMDDYLSVESVTRTKNPYRDDAD